MGLPLLRPMIMRAGRGRKATVRRKTRRRRSKKTEEGDKQLLWGRRRNSLTDNFTLAVYRRFLVAADISRALGADDPPFRPVMGKRGASGVATGADSASRASTTAVAAASETP